MIKIKNTDDLLLWAKFINAERKEEFEMLAQKNEAREKAVRDYNQGMKEATERGIEIGKIGIAKKLFSFGMTTEDIAEATGLSAEQVEELRKQS